MPAFHVQIEMNNSAFEDSPMTELGRIMRDLANAINRGDFACDRVKLRDINGNTVGHAEYMS